MTAEMPALEIRVTGHGVRQSPKGSAFACYDVVVSEGTETYTLHKRWSDLRACEEALQKTHAVELKELPAFEAHRSRLSTEPGPGARAL